MLYVYILYIYIYMILYYAINNKCCAIHQALRHLGHLKY